MTTLIATTIPVYRPGDFDWRELAACLGHPDPDIWHADGTSNDPWHVAAREEAKRICGTECLVQDDCLEYAMRTRQYTGIWGGKGPRDRTLLRKRLARATQREAR